MKSLKMADVTGAPMAITEPGLNTIIQVDLKSTVEKYQAILARPGEDLPGTNLTTIRDRAAIISVVGPIFHYENILTMVFGWPACAQVIQDLKAAQDNPAVDKIIMFIDSAGGQVGGLSDLTAFIKTRVTKPTIAYIGDMGASAAYWIASAADMIVAAETAEVGSVGVVLSARRRPDNQIEIVSSGSPKKRPDPDTDAGRAVLQARADALANVFVADVARNRGVTTGHILSLEGDVFIAKKALDLRLIDAIGTLENVVSGTAEKAPARQQTPQAGFMDLVNAIVESDGCKKSEAMERVAAREPHLYHAWLMDQQTGRTEPGASGPVTPAAGKTDFMELVREYQAAYGCKRSEALGVIAAAHPEAHQAWIQAQQN